MGGRAWIAALSGGGLAALGHAPFHFWYLAFPGFAALVWAVIEAGGPARAFRLAWAGAAVYFAITLHWIVEPFLVDAATHGWMAPGALLLLAGGLALFWGLAGWAALRFGGGALHTGFAFAVALTVMELVRGHLFTGFPWAMPAYIWAETPLRASAAFTGSYGLTFLTLVAAACTAAGVRQHGTLIAALALLALLFGTGQVRLADGSATRELGRVGLVHPNIPQTEKWVRSQVPGHIDRMLGLTRDLADENTDMIVWPEVAVVYPLDVAEPILAQASEAAGTTPLLLGINRRDGDNWYNALIQVDAGGTVSTTYDKVHLVPFGEYIPLRLGFLRAMAATSSNGFSVGEAVRLIDTPLGKALPLICYEGIFPRHIFQAGDRADYLLLVTNDAWFGTFAGPYQHLDQARFRAAEHGLPLVRVANAGVSTVIDRFGRLQTTLRLDEIASISEIVRSGPPTLYARTGNSLLLVVLAVVATGLIIANLRNPIAKDRS